jgi:hypothetical protein
MLGDLISAILADWELELRSARVFSRIGLLLVWGREDLKRHIIARA